MNYIGWLMCTFAGMVFYTLFGKLVKPQVYPPGHEATPKTFEYMKDSNGFFDDDEPINGVGPVDFEPASFSSQSFRKDGKELAVTEVISLDQLDTTSRE